MARWGFRGAEAAARFSGQTGVRDTVTDTAGEGAWPPGADVARPSPPAARALTSLRASPLWASSHAYGACAAGRATERAQPGPRLRGGGGVAAPTVRAGPEASGGEATVLRGPPSLPPQRLMKRGEESRQRPGPREQELVERRAKGEPAFGVRAGQRWGTARVASVPCPPPL
ncbi:uncharacterized protein LOC144581661 [Callithrix jacchus]